MNELILTVIYNWSNFSSNAILIEWGQAEKAFALSLFATLTADGSLGSQLREEKWMSRVSEVSEQNFSCKLAWLFHDSN